MEHLQLIPKQTHEAPDPHQSQYSSVEDVTITGLDGKYFPDKVNELYNSNEHASRMHVPRRVLLETLDNPPIDTFRDEPTLGPESPENHFVRTKNPRMYFRSEGQFAGVNNGTDSVFIENGDGTLSIKEESKPEAYKLPPA